MPDRLCDWCEGPIPPRSRRDAIFCKTPCRQAAHRFKRGRSVRPQTDQPLRLGYSDPPYPGTAARYYADHPDFDGEVDHKRLVEQLGDEFPDGWALSTSAEALPDVLASCPPGVRIAAWVRGERPTRSWRPLSAWEAVIYYGGRPRLLSGHDRRIDALVYFARPRLTEPRRVVGAKPAAFAYWLFDLLGALPGDELVDLFPGSGGVARAWRYYSTPDRRSSTAATHGPGPGGLATGGAETPRSETPRSWVVTADGGRGSVARVLRDESHVDRRDVFDSLRRGLSPDEASAHG